VLALAVFFNSATVVAEPKAPAIPDYPAARVTDNVWVIHGPREFPNVQNRGFMNNPGIVLTAAGAVIVDPGASVQSGEMVLRVLKKLSAKAVVAVFNTHIHGDHWLGNQAIKAAYPDVKIYAHPNMIAEAKAGAGENWIELLSNMTDGATHGTIAIYPDHAVNNADSIVIGDTHFNIYHNGQAHTKTDIMIEALEHQVIFLGDNVTYQRIPRMTDGTFKGSLEAIDIALASTAIRFVPGHGPSGDKSLVTACRGYLSAVYAAAKQAFDKDLDSNAVKDIALEMTSAYKHWPGYADELGRSGVQAFMEIEAAEF
jgi:glyoxylase-like metal-dependent hydrolase (beta-lactamase superfamily II)